jgi:hypothetical protein
VALLVALLEHILDELAEGMKERVPTEEEDPREAPHEPLKPSVARGRS